MTIAPPQFAIVVAVDRAGGIGRDNDLPWPRLPADLAHFRRTTSDVVTPGTRNAVIMGRRTWDSVPERYRPLPNRLNVVISRHPPTLPDGVLGATSLDGALLAATAAGAAQLFVVGGGQIYRDAVDDPRCAALYLTRLDGEFGCDTHFPAWESTFTLATTLSRHVDEAVPYVIERWVRR